IRMEDADQRPLLLLATKRLAAEQVPALARTIEGGQQRFPVAEIQLHAGALVAETDHVAVGSGTEGAAREAEVDGLEQIRLSRAVRPLHDGDGSTQVDPRVNQVAEPAALDCADHGHQPGDFSGTGRVTPSRAFT